MKRPQDTYVLIVDDDANLRDALALVVQNKGYRVLGADSGQAAISSLFTYPVDIVVSDVRMPGGSGIELLKEIREWHPLKPAVILISGFSDVLEEDVRELGAVKILQKPFGRATLVAELDKVIDYARPQKAG